MNTYFLTTNPNLMISHMHKCNKSKELIQITAESWFSWIVQFNFSLFIIYRLMNLNSSLSQRSSYHRSRITTTKQLSLIDLTNHDEVIHQLELKSKDLYYFWVPISPYSVTTNGSTIDTTPNSVSNKPKRHKSSTSRKTMRSAIAK